MQLKTSCFFSFVDAEGNNGNGSFTTTCVACYDANEVTRKRYSKEWCHSSVSKEKLQETELELHKCQRKWHAYETPGHFLRPRQSGRHFADDTFKRIFLNENVWIPIKISLKFVPKGPINNIPTLVLIMALRRPGDKPLSEPIMVS